MLIVRRTHVLRSVRVRGLVASLVTLPILLSCFAAPPAVAGAESAGSPAAHSILLSYGSQYGTPTTIHRGIDVAFAAGTTVRSATDGVVTFSGTVPSQSSPTRVGAVSVTTATGKIVTLSPVDSRDVSTGEVVVLGQQLGAVAPAGDGSSTGTHIHLSARVDGEYVDPTTLVGPWLKTYAVNSAAELNADPVFGIASASGASPAMPVVSAGWSAAAVPAQSALGGVAAAPAAPVGSPVAASALTELALRRELVSHPPTKLAARGVGTSPASQIAAAGAGVSDAQGEPHAGGWGQRIPTGIRYFGAGLAVLALGLGFALHVSGRLWPRIVSRRMGSAFAVRGIRW